jgi:hypothetical protein
MLMIEKRRHQIVKIHNAIAETLIVNETKVMLPNPEAMQRFVRIFDIFLSLFDHRHKFLDH